jgi:hypothetical protein
MKLSEIHIRDPFILAENDTYYLYGTRGADTWGKGYGFDVYVSRDLETFSDPIEVFTPPHDFWSDKNFWAPEVHKYHGKYYMLASFIGDTRNRGTQILVSESPLGPFVPHSNGPVTPAEWNCLDGTLYVDADGTPYMIYCKEWFQPQEAIVGEIHAIRLTDDLRAPIGEPIYLFSADKKAWVPKNPKRYVTDGPFVYKTESGKMLLLWSSFGEEGYLEAIAYPENGKLTDEWIHVEKPLFEKDGGHGMIFRTFDGRLMFTYHSPNKTPFERPAMREVYEKNDMLYTFA